MAMENKELNDKILRNVRSKIVVSNLEKEEKMKLKQRKNVISLCAIVVVLLSGSFLTVNAATDGKLAEKLQQYTGILTFNYDENTYTIKNVEEGVDSEGDNVVTYTLISEDGSSQIDGVIYTDNLEEENLKLEQKITEDGELKMMIENK